MRQAFFAAPMAILGLSGCASDGAEPSASTTVTATATTTVTTTVTAEPATVEPSETVVPDPLAGMFPKGFPKKVAVDSIPYPVDSAFEGFKTAVQLAPGVWAALPPGAAIEDVALAGTADGYCASIKAFERKYRGGDPLSGSCW